MQFRRDINGLRALAVLAVMIFHFNADWLSGGFVGVDVFFVVSGFLMTGIIFTGMETEKFALGRFYLARANRIIPALALVCLSLLLFGFFFLVPYDFRILADNVVRSLVFVSNIAYLSDSGYFARCSP